MPKPVFHADEAEFAHELQHGDRFAAKIAPISAHTGAEKLAYNITAVPPGKRAFPFHNHHNNEELFYIIAGRGRLRFGEDEYDVSVGDIISCPPGGPEVAHQLINTGEDELRYLAVSTSLSTDVFQYPDSGKFGVLAGRGPRVSPQNADFSGFYDEDTKVSYWKGE